MISTQHQVLCGQCHSYSAHLFDRLGAELGLWDGMTMTRDFCDELIDKCGNEIDFGGPAEYGGLSYCAKHVGTDQFWAYPYSSLCGELRSIMIRFSFIGNNGPLFRTSGSMIRLTSAGKEKYENMRAPFSLYGPRLMEKPPLSPRGGLFDRAGSQ